MIVLMVMTCAGACVYFECVDECGVDDCVDDRVDVGLW